MLREAELLSFFRRIATIISSRGLREARDKEGETDASRRQRNGWLDMAGHARESLEGWLAMAGHVGKSMDHHNQRNMVHPSHQTLVCLQNRMRKLGISCGETKILWQGEIEVIPGLGWSLSSRPNKVTNLSAVSPRLPGRLGSMSDSPALTIPSILANQHIDSNAYGCVQIFGQSCRSRNHVTLAGPPRERATSLTHALYV